MSSQSVVRVNSFVRGHHECLDIWQPEHSLRQERVVGHVPKLMAQWVTKFLIRASYSGTVVIAGKRINRGAGYGLELPCEFKFQGDKYSFDWLKEKLKRKTLMYCNRKKTSSNITFICTVLFSLKRCFYLGECVINALKLTCIVYCPFTGGYFRPCRPQIRVRVRFQEVSAYGRL